MQVPTLVLTLTVVWILAHFGPTFHGMTPEPLPLYSDSFAAITEQFLPCDATHSAAIAVTRCPSVCLSVCLSVTFVSCAKTNKDIFEFFSPSGSQAILVFPAKRDGDIPTGTPLTQASNAYGVGRNRDSERISGTYGLSSTASLPRNANWSISRPFPY